jgi:hypothetical protein
MSDFKCKCTKCNKEQSYRDLRAAYLDGWNVGRYAVCWDCQKEPVPATDDKLTALLAAE